MHRYLILLLLLPTVADLGASVTGNPTSYATGVWVQHPGISVARIVAADSRMVTVVGDLNGYLHAWLPDSTELPGFPVLINDTAMGLAGGGVIQGGTTGVNSTPALVDINGDGNLEIFVGSGDGRVYGLDYQGNALPGWPQFTGVSTGDGNFGVFGSPAVADLDGDGDYEVAAGAFSHFIYVWDANTGQILPGWPLNNADTVWSSPAVADLDHDGKLEVIIGADSTVPQGGLLRVLRYTGEHLPGWPRLIEQIIQSSPAVGDIDNDGELEIVVGTGLFYGDGRGEAVYAFEADGSDVAGWPHSLADADAATDNRPFSSPALVDIDGDDLLEIFIGAQDGYLYCINSDGSRRWSNTPAGLGENPANYALFSSPAVGDIDGDGIFEVVVGGGFHITAFDAASGQKESGYPIYTGRPDVENEPLFTWSSPTIADVDGDGAIDILIGTGRKDQAPFADSGWVRIYHESGLAGTTDLGPTGVSTAIAPWPRFRLRNSGSGSLSDSAGGGTNPITHVISSFSVAPYNVSPNGDGLNDLLSVQFSLTEADRVTAEVVDRVGAVVARPLAGQNLAAGNHSVQWNGMTLAGARANDGMYSLRVRADQAATVQRTFGVNTTISEVSTSWYLAEGSTAGFEAYILIQNPNTTGVTARTTFFLQDGTSQERVDSILARSRLTIPIHGDLPGVFSVSSRVESDLPIIVERAMYFNGNKGAHDSAGITNTNTTWYFAANRSFAGEETFITITNPSTISSAQLTATFYRDGDSPVMRNYTVIPNSRFTIPVHAEGVGNRSSLRIQSTAPIAAEKVTYSPGRVGGAAATGATTPSLSWYFAEGDTSILTSFSQIPVATVLDMFNPGNADAMVTINFMLENGSEVSNAYVVAAERRLTLDLGSQLGNGRRFSMEVLSSQPIVAERLMYSGTDTGNSIGSPTPAHTWNLAEGFTAFGFETWVVISNPGTQPANVTLTYQLQSGSNIIRNVVVGARGRVMAFVNDDIAPQQTSVSTRVTSDQPVVVERTMKFGNRLGMHQAMGVRQ